MWPLRRLWFLDRLFLCSAVRGRSVDESLFPSKANIGPEEGFCVEVFSRHRPQPVPLLSSIDRWLGYGTGHTLYWWVGRCSNSAWQFRRRLNSLHRVGFHDWEGAKISDVRIVVFHTQILDLMPWLRASLHMMSYSVKFKSTAAGDHGIPNSALDTLDIDNRIGGALDWGRVGGLAT